MVVRVAAQQALHGTIMRILIDWFWSIDLIINLIMLYIIRQEMVGVIFGVGVIQDGKEN